MSAESAVLDMTECSICTDVFIDPRMLPCIHTFCLKCLLNYGKDSQPGDTMPCPLCRKTFTVPDDGFAGMPKNFYVEKMLHARSQSAGTACESHKGERVKVFCLECKMAICVMCFIKSHKDHDCSDMEKVSADLRVQVKSDAEKVEQHLKKAEEFLRRFEEEKCNLIDQVADVASEVNEAADKLIDTVQHTRRKLLTEAEWIRQKRVEQLEAAKEELEEHMAELESFQQDSEILLSSGTACHVTRSAQSLHDMADELTMVDVGELVQKLLPSETVKFTSTNLVEETENLIGTISEEAGGESTAAAEAALRRPPVTPVISKGSFVGGLASVGDDLFVVRANSLERVEVYSAVTLALRRYLAVPGLGSRPLGLAACGVYKSLYVSDYDNNSVHRVKLSGDAVMKWLVAARPRCLSVNSAHNVLVTSEAKRKLQEFTTRGSLVRNIFLQPEIEWPMQAVQISTDKFLVSHCGSQMHRVCIVDAKGSVVRSYGGPPGSDLTQMSYPEDLAVDRHSNVLVADCDNHRLLVLDQSLSSAREMPLSVDGGLRQWPYRLCYDKARRRLCVAEYLGGRVIVVDNIKDFSTG